MFVFFKQKTAYEMRISDWSSDVCSSDLMANPYLCYAALRRAGLDGIQNKIHPGDPMDKNLYDLPPEELSEVPTVCSSLREALESLGADYEFLLKGDVFTKDQIDSYIELKYADVARWEMTPSP